MLCVRGTAEQATVQGERQAEDSFEFHSREFPFVSLPKRVRERIYRGSKAQRPDSFCHPR